MTQKVVYVQHRDTDLRDYHRYGMAAMVEAGLEVVVLNATQLVKPGYCDPRKGDDPLPGVTFVRVDDWDALARACRDHLTDARLVVMITGYTGSWRVVRLYRALGGAGVPSLVLSVNAYPGFSRYREQGWPARLQDGFKRLMAGQVDPLSTVLARVPFRWLSVRPADFMVLSGERSRAGANMYPVDGSTREIAAHASDYELYLSERAKGHGRENMAVFIDDCIGFNIDLQLLGEEPVTAEAYYPPLRAFFDRVEAELGLKVVVAGNPRIDYSGQEHLFGDRPVLTGRTAELVAKSRLVIGGRSTALGFAAMFRVPLMLVAMRCQYDHWVNKPAMDFFARDFATPVRFLDGPPERLLDHALALDEAAYDRYMRSYVKMPGSPELPFWRIVLDALTKAGVL